MEWKNTVSWLFKIYIKIGVEKYIMNITFTLNLAFT